MASLQSISEIAWRQIFPNPNDETKVTLAEFIATAKVEYAYRIWQQNKEDLAKGMDNNVPSSLLSTETLTVEDDKASIKDLKALRSLGNNSWIQLLGGEKGCSDCHYTVMDLNKWKLLCDDESRQNDKAAIVIGDYIKFPDGMWSDAKEVEITFANMGNNVDGLTIIEDSIAGLIRRSLIDIYGKQLFKEDKTNNSSGND